jgi:hypothetical protein
MDFANYWASAIATADLGETIEQSLRFRNNGRLQGTITTSSSTAALTISFWVKLGNIPSGSNRYIFSSGTVGNASGNISYNMGSNEAFIRFQDTSSFTAFSTEKLRDFSAWYHIVYRFDAASQFVKVYVNGSEHSSTSIATSARTSFGATSPMQIGAYADTPNINNWWDGYLAEWNMLFGTSLGPDSFGRTNDDGVWVPESLSSLTSNQYGALGNRLVFDSSAGLGDDTAPTGGTHASANDFTASGFDTADVALYSKDLSLTSGTESSSNPFENAFDGSTSTFATCNESSGTFSFNPDPAISHSSSVQVRVNDSNATATIGSTTVNLTANSLTTVVSGSGSFGAGGNALVIANTTTNPQIEQIAVDGTVLLDNTDNDVDYNDTPTSNYAVINVVGSTNQTAEEANLRSRASGSTADPDPPGLTVYKIPSDGDFYFECITDYGIDSSLGSWATGFFVDTEDIDHSTFNSSSIYTGGIGFVVELASNNYNNNANLGTSAQQDITTDGSTFSSAICGVRIKNNQITITRNGAATNVTDTTFSKLASTGDGFYRIYSYNFYGSSDPNGWTRWNFGQRPYVTAPSGVTPEANGIQTNNLPEPTIKNGKEHFEAKLYSGTGSSNAITGLEFSPDLIWIKVRDAADNHVLVDTIRGTDSVLFSNSTDAQASSFSRFTSFDSNGFTVNTTDTSWNNSANDYVAWCWKAGGTAVSNSDGTITSSVSANTDAGFSIVSYTGNGTPAATVGHGLTEPPEWILFKNRTSGSLNWLVYHKYNESSAGAGDGHQRSLILNTTAAGASESSMLNNTAPSNSVITLGTAGGSNGSTTMIAYCWHSVKGFSKFGSFVGNSSADGPFIYTGFRPAFILYKSSALSKSLKR